MTRLLAALLTLVSMPAFAQGVPPNTWQPIGPQFSTILSFERDPADPTRLLAGAYFGGLYRSTDFGFTWQPLPAPFSSRSVFSIARAADRLIYVGTFQGGIYRSADDGATWVAVNTGLADLDVQAVATDPSNAAVVLAATSNGGLYRTQDRGATWVRVDQASPALRGRAMAFDPVQPATVYLGTVGNGAYRSTDGGRSFAPFSTGLTAASVLTLRFGPSATPSLYAATDGGAFVLAAGATEWRDITGTLPPLPLADLVPHPSVPHMVFAATLTGVFLNQDARTAPAWTAWSALPARLVTIDPSGNVIHVATIHGGLEATTNFGQSWFQANWGIQNLFVGALGLVDGGAAGQVVFAGSDYAVHRDVAGQWATFFDQKQGVFAIQPDPATPGTLYLGSEKSGVWKSIDWGATWQSSSSDLVPSQVFSIAQSADGATLYAGTSSGLYLAGEAGDPWVVGNDAQLGIVFSIAPDPTRAPLLMVGGANGQVLRSDDGGFSFERASNGLPQENVVGLYTAPWEKTYAIMGGGGLFATSDRGLNWFPAKTGVPHQALAIVSEPVRAWVLYLGTAGGGVYKSESGSLDWAPRNQGLDSPVVFALAVDPAAPETVYAGTADGVFRSTDGAATWQRRSSGLPSGGVTAVAIDGGAPGVLYASVQDGGVYRSGNGGGTWTPVGAGVPAGGAVPVLVSRSRAGRLFAGSALRGIFRSDDSGATWQSASRGLTLFIRGLAIDPSSTSTLYAGSLGAGVFKSTDGAGTWANVGLRDRNVFKLAIDPVRPSTLYAATSRGVSRSADSGATWRELGQKAAFVHALAVDPRNRARVYVGTTAGSVFRSTDEGETWQSAGTGLPPFTVFALAVDAADGTVYAAPERQGVWRSTDDGTSWTRLPGGPLDSAFVSALTVAADRRVYAATLGSGIFAFAGGVWTLTSDGLASPQVADVEVLGSGGLIAATQDAGAFRSTNGGATWTWASSGLATSRVSSITAMPEVADGAYAATPDGVYRTLDGGATWHRVNTGLEQVNTWAVAVRPGDASRLLAATNGRGVARSDDAGASWHATASGLPNLDVRAIESGPRPGVAYAATLGGGVARTQDGGTTWSGGVTQDVVDTFILAVVVNPTTPSTVYVGTAGRGVLKTVNGGTDWQPVTNGLGSLFILSMAIDPAAPDTVFAGTADSGTFVTTNGGVNWQPLNTGLFNPVVTSLAVSTTGPRTLYAGTEGGGVFKNELALPASPCTYTVPAAPVRLGPGTATFTVEVTTASACDWRVESGSDWLAVTGAGGRTGAGTVSVAAALNAGQDARSGMISVAGQRVLVVQEGQATLFRLAVELGGAGTGLVTSDWIGIACGDDCEQLFTDRLPVVLTPVAGSGSVFVAWEGDADCADGLVVMAAARRCIARFEPAGPAPAITFVDVDGLVAEVRWTVPAGDASAGYRVEAAPRTGGTTIAVDVDRSARRYPLSLPAAGSWYFRVRGLGGAGLPSPERHVYAFAVPGRPREFAARVNGSNVTFDWLPPTNGTRSGYRLDVGTSPGAVDLGGFALPPNLTSLFVAAPPGSFFVRLVALNEVGASGPSNEVHVVVAGTPAAAAPPADVSVAAVGTTAVFRWSAPWQGGPVTEYLLDAGSAPGATDIVGGVSLGGERAFAAVAPPGTYFVRLRASGPGGISAASNEAVLEVPGPATPPSPPVLLRANVGAGNLVTFAWQAPVSGAATGHLLEVGSTPGAADLIVLALGAATSFQAPAPPGTYFVRVRAVNDAGSSAAGNEVHLVVPGGGGAR